MIHKILFFELKFLYKNFFAYVAYAALLFQGFWYVRGMEDFFDSHAAFANSAGNFYFLQTTTGMILMVIIAVITGTTLHRDLKEKSANYIYTLPINEQTFFISRFSASFLINVIFCLTYVVGMVLAKYVGVLPAERFGPTPGLQILHGFMLFALPNIFILSAIGYSALAFTRKIEVSYMAIFSVMMFLVIMEKGSQFATDFMPLIMILEPTCFVYVKENIDVLSATERNTLFFKTDAIYFLNRLLWVGGSIVALWFAMKKFSFKSFYGGESKPVEKRQQTADDSDVVDGDSSISDNIPASGNTLSSLTLNFSFAENLKKVFRLARLEFNNVVRPTSFKIILAVIVLSFIVFNVFYNPSYFIGATLPLTEAITITRYQISFMVIMIIMIWANDLFFKEKTANLWQISETTPSPIWVPLMSKFIAMSGVTLLIAILMLVCGVAKQLLMGFTDIDWLLYIDNFFGYRMGWLFYLMFIAFVLFVGGVTGQRYATIIFCVAYFVIVILSVVDLGLIEQVRFVFGFIPGTADTYSGMNHYGIHATASFSFFILWSLLSLVFVIVGTALWQRGTGKHLVKRAVFAAKSSPIGVIVVAGALLGFVSMQFYIVENMNHKRNFVLTEQQEAEAAAYEAIYKPISRLPQPKISNINLKVDLFPEQRAYSYQATLDLVNPSDRTIDVLYLNVDYFSKIDAITLNGKPLQKLEDDDVLGMEKYQISGGIPALGGSEKSVLYLSGSKKYTGFPQRLNYQADLAYNGLLIERILPVIGYDAGKELQKNKARQEQGLEILQSRMSTLKDTAALTTSYGASDVIRTKGETIVSTSSSQYAYAPGKLVDSWQKDDRNYFKYLVAEETPLNWHIGSGEYEENRKAFNGHQVKIQNHPRHSYHVDKFFHFVESSLSFFSSSIGAYPYDELRIVEIPFYQDDYYAFANVIAIAENEGWYVDMQKTDVQAYVHLSITREMIKQWLQAKANIADVQGAEMLLSSIPEAIALEHIEAVYGKEHIDLIFSKKEVIYNKGKGNEPNAEPPLIYADGMEYLEPHKGTIAVYLLIQEIGFSQFIALFKNWVNENGNKHLVFMDFYSTLKAKGLISDEMVIWFEKVELNLGV